ncbi:hypothetical protein FQN50_009918, partial [Emmonsiellopsis sp. PD_5]
MTFTVNGQKVASAPSGYISISSTGKFRQWTAEPQFCDVLEPFVEAAAESFGQGTKTATVQKIMTLQWDPMTRAQIMAMKLIED